MDKTKKPRPVIIRLLLKIPKFFRWLIIELAVFAIGVFANYFLCSYKKEFTLAGFAKEEYTSKPLANINIDIDGIGSFRSNNEGTFYIPKFKTYIPLFSWWPGCNCSDGTVTMSFLVMDSTGKEAYSTKETFNLEDQTEDTLSHPIYFKKNEK